MGISKTEHFTEEQNEVAKLMKALSHPKNCDCRIFTFCRFMYL